MIIFPSFVCALKGNNMTLVHIAHNQPVPGMPLTVELDMVEMQFMHEATGARVTREQFMTMLSGILSLQIRASYYTVIDQVMLSEVHLDQATPTGTGSQARNVEQCQCPPNYQGSSCEVNLSYQLTHASSKYIVTNLFSFYL